MALGRSQTFRKPGFPLALLLILWLASMTFTRPAVAQPTALTAYKAQTPVTLDGVVSPGEWTDTPSFYEPVSQMTVAFKQNGTGLLFLMQWAKSGPCVDQACFGGVEFGFLNNTGAMGSPTTPTLMVLASPSFTGNVDEFISTGELTPETVEAAGYSTQSVCGLGFANGNYTAECYRPFALHNAWPDDPFPSLAAGNTIEVGFAVGEFTSPGDHDATDMSSYTLTLSNQTYSPPSTTSSSTSITTSEVSSTTSTTSASSSSLTVSSSTTSTTSTTTLSSVSAPPSAASTYAEELLVLSIGFTVLILVALAKYERS